MLYSKANIKTIKENPASSNLDSYSLMVRASLIKKMGSTYYSFLPMGNKVFQNISSIIDKKLEENGVLEVFNGYNNETMLYSIIKDLINKHDDLPTILSSTKEINRKNSKSGYGLVYNSLTIIKKIEAVTKDIAQAREVFNKITLLIIDIFNQLNIKIQPIQVGEDSAEILAFLENGDRDYLLCDTCNYAASSEHIIPYFYKSILPSSNKMIKVHTPNMKSIEDLSKFFNYPKSKFIKTLFFDSDGRKILTITRGDRRVSKDKLKKVLDTDKLEQEDPRYIERVMALPVGFLGPVNLEEIFIIADYSIRGMIDAITGANEADHHYINVNAGRDFSVDMIADITEASGGDLCPICKKGNLFKGTGVVLSSLSIDTKDSYLEFTDGDTSAPLSVRNSAIISNYDIDINRVFSMLVQQNKDEKGIVWPKKIAPYDVLIIDNRRCSSATSVTDVALLHRLINKNILIDDRDKSMGIKFNDSELLGIPYRIVISKKAIEENLYEITTRNDLKTKKKSVEEIIKFIDN